MYIYLFHGRKNPDEILENWGDSGPIIGPVEVSWTYGNIKLHNSSWLDDFEFLTVNNDLVYFDGMYYGDFEVWADNDPLLSGMEKIKRVISFDEFIKIQRK